MINVSAIIVPRELRLENPPLAVRVKSRYHMKYKVLGDFERFTFACIDSTYATSKVHIYSLMKISPGRFK